MDALIDNILASIEKTLTEKKEISLPSEDFHPIKDDTPDHTLVFIDGGNAEILSAASFSVQLIRLFAVYYRLNKRIRTKKAEFFVLISSKDNTMYSIESFGSAFTLPPISVSAKELSKSSTQISAIGDIVRKCAEMYFSTALLDDLSDNDLLVIDGDLTVQDGIEKLYLTTLCEKALSKKVLFAALSKTSELLTEDGNSLIAALHNFSGIPEWYPPYKYATQGRGGDIELFLTKLRSKSKHIFKVEICGISSFSKEAPFSLLRKNASDPVFYGYPYGLIEADRFARISKKEASSLQMSFRAKAGSSFSRLEPYLNALNAHEILDKIS